MLSSPYVKSLAPAAIVGVGAHFVVGKPVVTGVATVVTYLASLYMMMGGPVSQ